MLCTDPTIIDTLSPPSPDEVSLIFSHPLEAIIDPSLALQEPLSEKGGVNWPYQEEIYVRPPLVPRALLMKTEYYGQHMGANEEYYISHA